MQRLRQMAIFAQVVESGSISAAAEALQLSKSVVSQHLKGLESSLGVTLLKRTTRRQQLTVLGESFYQQCRLLTQVADDAWHLASAAQTQVQGEIRITAAHALTGALLVPALTELMREYPLLQPQIISDDQPLNLHQDNIDLALRVGRSADSNAKQRRIGAFRDVLCGRRDLLQTTDVQALPYIANNWQGRDIVHDFARADESLGAGSAQALAGASTKRFFPQVQCRADNFHTCLALIRSGAGIGIVPDFIFRRYQHELQAVWPDYQLPQTPVYLLHLFNQNPPQSLLVCADALQQQLQLQMTEKP